MKLEMELKPKDIALLKLLGCVLIAFFMIRFLIFPAVEKHMDLTEQRDNVVAQQEEMQTGQEHWMRRSQSSRKC